MKRKKAYGNVVDVIRNYIQKFPKFNQYSSIHTQSTNHILHLLKNIKRAYELV